MTSTAADKPKAKRRRARTPPELLSHIYSAMDCFPSFLEAKAAVLSRYGGARGVRAADAAKKAEAARIVASCANWNARYPVGTRVAKRVLLNGPEVEVTRTRSAAWVASGHVSVMIEGQSGGYGIEWLRPLAEDEEVSL